MTELDNTVQPVLFWRTTDEFGCGSNFSKHPITVDGLFYKTSENYYQARKFTGVDHLVETSNGTKVPVYEYIRNQKGPMGAAKEGRRRDFPMRRDWDKLAGISKQPDWLVKDVVMWNALCYKTEQHPKVKEELLATGDREIVEASPMDPYWGWGANKKGKNMLGKLWMKLRDDLRTIPGAMERPTMLLIKRGD